MLLYKVFRMHQTETVRAKRGKFIANVRLQTFPKHASESKKSASAVFGVYRFRKAALAYHRLHDLNFALIFASDFEDATSSQKQINTY